MYFTLVIMCAVGAKCWLLEPWVSKRAYGTQQECLWMGEEVLKFLPIERNKFKVECRENKS